MPRQCSDCKYWRPEKDNFGRIKTHASGWPGWLWANCALVIHSRFITTDVIRTREDFCCLEFVDKKEEVQNATAGK